MNIHVYLLSDPATSRMAMLLIVSETCSRVKNKAKCLVVSDQAVVDSATRRMAGLVQPL